MPPAPLPYPAPPLTDGTFGVRRWSEADVDCVRQASSDPLIPQWTTVPPVFTAEEGLAFVRRQWSRAEDGVGVSQAIVEAGTDRAIGLVIVTLRPQPGVGGLGYWVVPDARGRGAAAAAVRLVVPWAFEALGLQRLEAWVVPDNVASRRVLAAAGFREEGLLRSFLPGPEGPVDVLVHSVVREDLVDHPMDHRIDHLVQVPPRITFVTLGAVDVRRLRRFYAAWGWQEGPGGGEDFAQFLLHTTRFALYRRDLLHAEAAPDLPDAGPGTWSGVTLAVNVGSRDEVDTAFRAAVAAGARVVAAPTAREWGGYSGYVADPEGHRWEIAWLEGYDLGT